MLRRDAVDLRLSEPLEHLSPPAQAVPLREREREHRAQRTAPMLREREAASGRVNDELVGELRERTAAVLAGRDHPLARGDVVVDDARIDVPRARHAPAVGVDLPVVLEHGHRAQDALRELGPTLRESWSLIEDLRDRLRDLDGAAVLLVPGRRTHGPPTRGDREDARGGHAREPRVAHKRGVDRGVQRGEVAAIGGAQRVDKVAARVRFDRERVAPLDASVSDDAADRCAAGEPWHVDGRQGARGRAPG